MFDSKRERSVHRFGNHFVHNGWANVAPLAEYTGQRNYHKKVYDPSTERVIFSPQLAAITPSSCAITRYKGNISERLDNISINVSGARNNKKKSKSGAENLLSVLCHNI